MNISTKGDNTIPASNSCNDNFQINASTSTQGTEENVIFIQVGSNLYPISNNLRFPNESSSISEDMDTNNSNAPHTVEIDQSEQNNLQVFPETNDLPADQHGLENQENPERQMDPVESNDVEYAEIGEGDFDESMASETDEDEARDEDNQEDNDFYQKQAEMRRKFENVDDYYHPSKI